MNLAPQLTRGESGDRQAGQIVPVGGSGRRREGGGGGGGGGGAGGLRPRRYRCRRGAQGRDEPRCSGAPPSPLPLSNSPHASEAVPLSTAGRRPPTQFTVDCLPLCHLPPSPIIHTLRKAVNHRSVSPVTAPSCLPLNAPSASVSMHLHPPSQCTPGLPLDALSLVHTLRKAVSLAPPIMCKATPCDQWAFVMI